MVSSGVREQIRYLTQHKWIDVLVTSAGGVEEDLIKCLGNTYLGDFRMDGAKLRSEGLNRIGNMLVPNSNYCAFEDWVMPILDAMVKEQNENDVVWTPSKVTCLLFYHFFLQMIHRLGKEIQNPESICYWAFKNQIPIYCPALTDGSFGTPFRPFAKTKVQGTCYIFILTRILD